MPSSHHVTQGTQEQGCHLRTQPAALGCTGRVFWSGGPGHLLPERLWGEQGFPESGSLTPPDCSLQVQLDTLPGMSLVAGKALSSARMADAVLSQSSLMGSQQFQDGEDEGKTLPVDTPGHFPRGSAPDLCGNSALCKEPHTVSLPTDPQECVCEGLWLLSAQGHCSPSCNRRHLQ